MKKVIIRNIKTNEIVSEIDLSGLHRYILTKISNEFGEMVKECYYPKVATLYKELLYRTKSEEKKLIQYSKDKYKNLSHAGNKNLYKLLYDPYNTLLIIIIQEFLKENDIAGAESTFHLFALRQYTNLLYKYTTPKSKSNKQPLCVPEYFKQALSQLSQNHIFNSKKTIANSIMYFSRVVFKKYMSDIKKDDPLKICLMIYEVRSRLNQSMQSFFHKYYDIAKNKGIVKTKEEESWDPTYEVQLKTFISNISRDMCVYKKINQSSISEATSITKFNKKLAQDYVKELSTPKYIDNINTSYFLMLKSIKDLSQIKTTKFFDHIKKLMSIKTTKQPLYFKKVITTIHDEIIVSLKLTEWFGKLSVQSKAISRNFIAYYLASFLKNYI